MKTKINFETLEGEQQNSLIANFIEDEIIGKLPTLNGEKNIYGEVIDERQMLISNLIFVRTQLFNFAYDAISDYLLDEGFCKWSLDETEERFNEYIQTQNLEDHTHG